MSRRPFYIFVLLLILAPLPALGAEGFGALISPGKLAKSHAKYEGIRNCTECHVLTGGVQDKKCLDCHDKLAKKIKEKKSAHSKYTKKCIVCHRDHKGRKYQMVNLDEEKFEHDDTGYELKFEHKQVECAKCHKKAKKNKYSGLKQECVECHDNAHKRQFKGRGCDECHTERDWEEETFKHDSPEYEGYKLTGKHLKVECAECHVRGRFKPIKTKTCDSALCHKDEHKKQFKGQKCEKCHTTKSWEEETFKHDSPDYKGYKLEGKHLDVKCAECHVKGKYKPIKTKTCDSAACHKNEHKDQFKGQSCDECHTVKGWDVDAFDHDSKDYDGYKLEGKHREVKCAECHIKGVFKPIKETCITCHKDDDDHKNELGKVCENCHNVNDWKKVKLDHDTRTDFPLIGKHNGVACNECHTEKKGDRKIYKNGLFECEDCHDDYHEGEYEEKCKSCHTQYDWEPRNYKHYEKTGYRLEGAHNDTRCTNCHVSGGTQFKNVNRICGQCHLTPHFNQFGGDCSECHTSSNWAPTKFDHALSGFILTGNHRFAECRECHDKRSYRNTPIDCIACHLADYNATATIPGIPDHVALSYPVECRDCHLVSFIGWDFNHATVGSDCASCHLAEPRDAVTHAKYGIQCELCHSVGSNWLWSHPSLGSGVQCSACHIGYSDIPRSAKHDAGGWVNCEECHNTTTSWLPPSFNHAGVTNGCARCHLTYTGLTSPPRTSPHNIAKFGGIGDSFCEECHTNGAGPTWPFVHTTSTATCMPCHLNYSTPARSTSRITHSVFTVQETLCEQCHSGTSPGNWLANAAYNHAGSSGICHTCHLTFTSPVRSTPHNTPKFGGAGDNNCELCHTTTTAWLPFQHVTAITGCATCHLNDTVPVKPANHVTLNWTVCEDCHSSTTAWATHSFAHTGVTTGCNSCHPAYSATTRVTPHNTVKFGGLGDTLCETCHSTSGGSLWPFQHAPALTGCATCHLNDTIPAKPANHVTLNWTICEDCHSSTTAWATHSFAHTGVTTGCNSCHPGYSATPRTTPHSTVKFGGIGDTTCETCHTTGGAWAFQHDPAATNCATCHAGAVATPTLHAAFGTACGDCHSQTGVGGSWTSPVPNYTHVGTAGICDSCHGAATTFYASFTLNYRSNVNGAGTRDHSDARFGGQGNTNCDVCHTSTNAWTFTHAPATTNCSSCHASYSAPAQPANHTANTWTVCEDCHSPSGVGGSWTPVSFNHTGVTTGCNSCHINYSTPARATNHTLARFGGIGDTTCEECHTTGGSWAFQHAPTLTGCATCHLNYSNPAQPANHATNGWTVCEQCHSPSGVGGSWTPVSFNHTGVTTGCNSCHLNYSTPPRTTSHTLTRFGGLGDTTCEECHNTSGGWAFQHAPTLTGCSTCHLSYSTPPRNTTVNHSNFTNENTCEECHSPSGVGGTWLPPNYDHTGVTTGCLPCHTAYTGVNVKTPAHTTNGWITCEECHLNTGVNWVFNHNLAPGVVCNSCHLTVSTPAQPGNHSANGWVDCEICHQSATAWGSNISFNHNSTGAACSTCHSNYTNTPKSAQHTTNGWTVCEQCHSPGNSWVYNHIATTFPLNHHTSPSNCNDCHPGGNYTNSGGCIECHTRKRVDTHHTNRGNPGCLDCHPRGR